MSTFQDFSLSIPLQEALARIEYLEPTEIQAKSIPVALEGNDILGSAQTGTGKTAAFSIPMVNKLIEDPAASALILTPTRELAEQVITFLHQLLNKRRDIKTVLLIGGVSIQKQLLRLKDKPRVIVGTPGRINDHLERRSLSLKTTQILVLDEADRMLDMGFGVQLATIAEYLPAQRQTFMFSATMPKRILSLADKFLSNPVRIKVGATHAPLAKIKQDIIRTSEDKKFPILLKEVEIRNGSILIFAKTKRKVDLLAKKLNAEVPTVAMHGDLRQHQRTRVLKDFREQKFRVLVATDVAARGLDISHIEHVINYDLPQSPEDYIHRIGRTARGTAQGSALCFISKEDEKYWRAIEKLLGGDESQPAFKRGGDSRPRNSSGSRDRYDSKPGARGRKPASDRPYAKAADRSFDRKPRGSDKSSSESPYAKKPRGDSPFGKSSDKPFAKRPRNDSERSFAKPSDGAARRPRKDSERSYAKPSDGAARRPRKDSERSFAKPSDGAARRPRKDSERSFAKPSDGAARRPRKDSERSFAKPSDTTRAPRRDSERSFDRTNDKPFSKSPRGAVEKPAASKPHKTSTKKSYGPQNRPKRKMKTDEELD